MIGGTTHQKHQSSRKTEANIEKGLLQTMFFKNKQPLLQTSTIGHKFLKQCHFKRLPDI